MWSSSQVHSIGPFWSTFLMTFCLYISDSGQKFRTKLSDKYGGYLWQVPASTDVLPRSVKTCAIQKLRSVGHLTCGFPRLVLTLTVPYASAHGSTWELLNTLRELNKLGTTTHTGVGGPAVSVLCRTSSIMDVHNNIPCLDTQNLATSTPMAYQWYQGWGHKRGRRQAVH